jgi:hypothetical protein
MLRRAFPPDFKSVTDNSPPGIPMRSNFPLRRRCRELPPSNTANFKLEEPELSVRTVCRVESAVDMIVHSQTNNPVHISFWQAAQWR